MSWLKDLKSFTNKNNDPTRPYPIYLKILMGALYYSTIINVILKLTGVLHFSWKIALIPLWIALGIGFILGFYWFVLGMIAENKNKK
jgi:hypothetical protein